MQQAQAHAEDLRLDTESRLICKGSALVRFEYLNWNEYLKLNEVKGPDPEHVEYVKRIFRKSGCRKLQVRHHIPAVIDQHQLDTALEDARGKGRWKTGTLPSNTATIDTQDGYPELEFPGGIECLHGLHRVQAGKEWLPSIEKWWIVDLYLSGISYELKTLLVEEYANEKKPCDGKIYRKIREYQLLPGKIDCKVSPTTCVSFEMRWWASFNLSREKKLRSLFRSSLTAYFDALMKIPALFDAGMMVTTLHKMMPTKCYEQIQHYLEHTGKVWDDFLSGVKMGRQRVDKVTVRVLELRAPGVSTLDAQFLRGHVLEGVIFSGFSTPERTIIWENILAFKGVIPSLSKFFQDIHFLEACVDGVKWLVTVPRDKTLFTALEQYYKSQGESQLIQTTETTLETASSTDGMRLGFLVLVAFAMRNHQNLPKAPVKKNLKTIPRVKADQEVLKRFAALAEQLGFNSPEIKALKGDLDPLPILDIQKPVPLLVTTGPGMSIKQRCGLPHTDTFEEDRKHLFLHNLCEMRDETGEGITSFFILKSWFTAFFNPPPWTRPVLSMGSPNPPPPQAHQQHVDEEDVNMGDLGPRSPDQPEREQEQIIQVQDLDTNEQMQDSIELVKQRMSWFAKEANRRLEIEQGIQPHLDELFVPREPGTRSQDTESGNITIIRFVEQDGNECEMLNPLQEYGGEVLVLRVDHGDPTSLVEQQVQEFLRNGKRTCDRYKKIIPAEECYGVATKKENKNTLFLIPDIESQEKVQEADGQGYQVADGGEQAMEDMKDYEIPQEREVEQAHTHEPTEREYQVTQVLESRRIPQQETQGEESDDLLDDLLDPERDNAANACILDKSTTIIYVTKRVGDPHDVSKPAKYWEWTDCVTLEVPTGDPQDVVMQRMKMFWEQMRLKPHDSNLRRLEYEDCYKAAKEDEHHTLYMMKPSQHFEEEKAAESTVYLMAPSPQTEENKAVESTVYLMAPSPQTEENKATESTLPSKPPPLTPQEMLHWHPPSIANEQFYWHDEHNRRRLHASPQAQEETSFGRTTLFVAPSNIPQFPPPPNNPQLPPPPNIPKLPLPPQQELVESMAEFHKDKIGRGPDKLGGPDKRGRVRNRQNRIGMSYKEDVIEIRKTPGIMRITQQPSQQANWERKDRRFKDLKTRPKEMAKQNESFRQDYAELPAVGSKDSGEEIMKFYDEEEL